MDAVDRAKIEIWSRRIESEILNMIGNVASHTDPLFKDRVCSDSRLHQDPARCRPGEMGVAQRELDDGSAFIAGESFSVTNITGMAASWLGAS